MELSEEPQIESKDEIDLKESQNDANQDLVFGEITEEGPNYRNVCTDSSNHLKQGQYSNFYLGRSVRNGDSHDEDPNWSGCSRNTDYI